MCIKSIALQIIDSWLAPMLHPFNIFCSWTQEDIMVARMCLNIQPVCTQLSLILSPSIHEIKISFPDSANSIHPFAGFHCGTQPTMICCPLGWLTELHIELFTSFLSADRFRCQLNGHNHSIHIRPGKPFPMFACSHGVHWPTQILKEDIQHRQEVLMSCSRWYTTNTTRYIVLYSSPLPTTGRPLECTRPSCIKPSTVAKPMVSSFNIIDPKELLWALSRLWEYKSKSLGRVTKTEFCSDSWTWWLHMFEGGQHYYCNDSQPSMNTHNTHPPTNRHHVNEKLTQHYRFGVRIMPNHKITMQPASCSGSRGLFRVVRGRFQTRTTDVCSPGVPRGEEVHNSPRGTFSHQKLSSHQIFMVVTFHLHFIYCLFCLFIWSHKKARSMLPRASFTTEVVSVVALKRRKNAVIWTHTVLWSVMTPQWRRRLGENQVVELGTRCAMVDRDSGAAAGRWIYPSPQITLVSEYTPLCLWWRGIR